MASPRRCISLSDSSFKDIDIFHSLVGWIKKARPIVYRAGFLFMIGCLLIDKGWLGIQ